MLERLHCDEPYIRPAIYEVFDGFGTQCDRGPLIELHQRSVVRVLLNPGIDGLHLTLDPSVISAPFRNNPTRMGSPTEYWHPLRPALRALRLVQTDTEAPLPAVTGLHVCSSSPLHAASAKATGPHA